MRVRRLPGPSGRTAIGAVPRLENGWARGPWGFDSLSFRLLEAWLSWQSDALLARTRLRRRSQVRVLLPRPHSGVVEWEDARLLPARRRFEPCRRSLIHPLAVGKTGIPPDLGSGDRWFDSSRPDLRGRGAAVLASLMSSRSWVRIPPALPVGGVAQTSRALACQARGRRFESGRPRSMVAVV
jgi:hypothetical protein